MWRSATSPGFTNKVCAAHAPSRSADTPDWCIPRLGSCAASRFTADGCWANNGTSSQQSDHQSFLHAILLGRRAHDVGKSVPGLCLQEQSDFQGVLPEWHRKDVQCNKEASYKRSAKLDRTFGNSEGESQVPVANAYIAGWLSDASTSLWMNQQHVEGLLLSTLTSRVSPSPYQNWQRATGADIKAMQEPHWTRIPVYPGSHASQTQSSK
jgi:hypothetical protein